MGNRTFQWSSVAEIHDLSEQIEVEQLFQAIMSSWRFQGGQSLDQDSIAFESNDYIQKIKRDTLDPLVVDYLHRHFTDRIDNERIHANGWAHVSKSGSTLDVHHHSGAHLSTVLYIECGGGDIVLVDPRHQAMRGYPVEMFDRCLSTVRHTPVSGEFLIMPSYIHHHVCAADSGLRVSMPIDYFIDHQ